MRKYFSSSIAGFLINTVLILFGSLINYNSPLNIARVYIEILDRQPAILVFGYALLFTLIFIGIFRLILIRTKYTTREKWLMSIAAGIGFHLSLWALFGVLYLMVSGAQIG